MCVQPSWPKPSAKLAEAFSQCASCHTLSTLTIVRQQLATMAQMNIDTWESLQKPVRLGYIDIVLQGS